MFGWVQQIGKRGRPAARPVDQADEKRKLEIKDLSLGIEERQLKIGAIKRVVESEPDPILALEVVTVATHRGRMPPSIPSRKPAQQSPLELMALSMLQKRLEEDPTDALDRILDRRERLEDAADRLSGKARADPDGDTGNTFVDVARALANSPLGEAIGSVLGASAQQRMAVAAAAAAGPGDGSAVATGGTGAGGSAIVAPTTTPILAGPRPASFRVSMAIRTLRAMSPEAGARWILGMAETNPAVGELLGPFVAAEPAAVPVVLEAFVAEAGADPQAAEWLPLVAWLCEAIDWTLAAHAALRALMFEDADDDRAAG